MLPAAPPADALLVEGKDDQHVCWALFQHHSLPKTFKVLDKDGFESLRLTLAAEIKAAGRRCLGVVVDADADIAIRWQSLSDVLRHVGYVDVPEYPDAGGTILAGTDVLPRLGVWLMPDNALVGMLEDFVAFLVPEGDPLLARAREAVAGITGEVAEAHRFSDGHRAKAEIHTWLAWQKDPGRPMGLAVTSRFLDGDCAQAMAFVAWVRRLFEV